MESALGIKGDKDDRILNRPALKCEGAAVMKARLDPATERILLSMLGSPKTPSEVSRIQGIPVSFVWQKVRWLETVGLLRETLSFVDSSGSVRTYFETTLPDDEVEEEEIALTE